MLGRYTIVKALGAGTSGTTYEATATAPPPATPDSSDSGPQNGATGQRRVAVKELALGRIKSWKQLELFEREAATLRGLRHPGIPEYVEYAQEEGCFFLVQALADGPTLAQVRNARCTSARDVTSKCRAHSCVVSGEATLGVAWHRACILLLLVFLRCSCCYLF